jgi:hypothetical protein
MNLMEDNIPEEIQIKLKFFEKALNEKRWPDNKTTLWLSLLGLVISFALIILYSSITASTRFISLVIFILVFSLASNSIARYFEYKKFSKVIMNACEVINYYRNRN